MNQATHVSAELKKYEHPEKAVLLQRFFKTAPGQYGEGDLFLAITVPDCRKVAKQFYKSITLSEIETLLASGWHEERLTALLMLVLQYPKATAIQRQDI